MRQMKNIFKRNFCTSIQVKETNEKLPHVPVMKQEVIEHLNVRNGDTIIDMTFGAGGHSKSLLEKYPNLKIIALDRDPIAIAYAKDLQKELPNQIVPLLGRFSELNTLAEQNNISPGSIDGVLFDLGASSMQMDTGERGFSISKSGPLDMRMDGDRCDNITAADVINHATESQLMKIFKNYGEEKHSKIIARSIVQARITYKFKTTKDLADLIDLIVGARHDKLQRRAHGGTKIFQALRIFVNNELNEFNYGLILANRYLKLGGRVVVLSFHSLEDRLAKEHFQGHINDNVPYGMKQRFNDEMLNMDKKLNLYNEKPWKPINKKVIVPTEEEVQLNPRSRSAKLRAAEKIGVIQEL